jgi:two-component system alkaline phosphatase synthesis response regulator PhoP
LVEKKRILIVEDEQDIANVFKKQLQMIAGFDVTIIDDGENALDSIENEHFDLILLDLIMTNIDGLEFLQKLKQSEHKQIPVIILTNVSSDEARAKAKELGAQDFVVKTDVQPQQLIDKINSYIQ